MEQHNLLCIFGWHLLSSFWDSFVDITCSCSEVLERNPVSKWLCETQPAKLSSNTIISSNLKKIVLKDFGIVSDPFVHFVT